METYKLKENEWHKDVPSAAQYSFLTFAKKDDIKKDGLKGEKAKQKIERATIAADATIAEKLDAIYEKIKVEDAKKIVHASITVDGNKSRGIINYVDEKGVFRQKRF